MKNTFALILFTVTYILIAQNAMAHGGHKKETAPVTAPEPKAATDSVYATEEKKSDPFGNSMFSPTDLFMENEIVPPTQEGEMKMEGSHNESEAHNMPKVEVAKRQAVATSSKGYGTAVGITVLAGLVFAGLTFIRPGE